MSQALTRPARPEDFDGVLDLYGHLDPDNRRIDPGRARTVWAQIMAGGSTLLVAELGGRLVSTCALAIVPNLTRQGRPYALVENVVTHPGHRRQGHGRAVLVRALERAWATGCYKVMLSTGSQRPETLAFYEACGFAKGTKTFFEARNL
jgi:GNAT superfamily N-acetyltransferase